MKTTHPTRRMAAWLAALLALPLAATAAQSPTRLVTSSPQDSYSPVVSADGDWLLFVSERDGLPGLYIQRIARGNISRPQPFLPHPARTISPVLSPDGRRIAFVSYREDALADVFLAEFPSGRMTKVTERGRIDDSPRFSADGRILFFRSGTVLEEMQWQAYDLATGATTTAAEPPPPEPPPPFAIAAIDTHRGAALLYSDDTNGDGDVGEGDDPTAWRLVAGQWRQQTLPVPGGRDITLHPTTGELYIAARWTNNLEIAVAADPVLLSDESAAALMERAERALRASAAGIEPAIAWYRAAAQRAASPEERLTAEFRLIQLMNRAGRHRQAMITGERLLDTEGDPLFQDRVRTEVFLARIELAARDAARQLGQPLPREDFSPALVSLRGRFESLALHDDACQVSIALGRLYVTERRFTDALDQVRRVFTYPADSLSVESRCRALIFQSSVYTEMQLGSEAAEALLGVFALAPDNTVLKESAAAELIRGTLQQTGRGWQEQQLALRRLAARGADYPYLVARLRLEEGRVLRRARQMEAAAQSFAAAAELVSTAGRPAVDAVIELATLQLDRGEFDAAIATIRTGRAALEGNDDPAAAAAITELGDRLAQYFLRKGREEIRLGDHLLAARTFETLLEFDPRHVEAWRGRIQALSVSPKWFEPLKEELRAATRTRPDDALAWYNYGLALTYDDPSSRTALRAIQRAIAIDSSVPYYFLTEGFIHEQRYKDAEARGRTPYELLDQAILSFETAIALTPLDEAHAQLRADLLLNAGNAAIGLRQYQKAHDYYRQRERIGAPFGDPRTELLYRLNGGIAAFRSSEPATASRFFRLGLGALDTIAQRKLLPPDRIDALRLELTGRRALAIMEQPGREADALALFRTVYTLSPPASLARVRALRNQAVILDRQSARLAGAARLALLAEAESIARRAVAELDNPELTGDPAGPSAGGLLNFVLSGSTNRSAANAKADGFDVADEARLLQALIGRLAQLQGRRPEAIAALEKQIALDPKLNDSNRAYYTAARSVTIHRIAGEALRMGRLSEALDHTLDGLAIAQFTVARQPIVDSNAATVHLARLAEILALDPSRTVATDRARALWCVPAVPPDAMPLADLIDAAAAHIEALDDPLLGAPRRLVTAGAELARLEYARAVAAESRWRRAVVEAANRNGIDRVAADAEAARHGAACLAAARRVIALATTPDARGERYRLGLIAHGLQLRLLGDGEGRLEAARLFAADTGQAHRQWWLAAQAALAMPDPAERASAASAVAAEILAAPLVALDVDDTVPWELLDDLEQAELAPVLAADAPEDAWAVVDRWRAVRLRWMADTTTPPIADERARQWGRELDARRTRWRDAQRRLHESTWADVAARATQSAAAARAAVEIAQSFATAPPEAAALAAYFRPAPSDFGPIDQLLELDFLFDAPPVFVLHRQLGGTTVLAAADRDATWFVTPERPLPTEGRVILLGDPLDAAPAALNLLSINALYSRFERLSLRPADARVEVTPAMLAGPLPATMAAAREAVIVPPARMVGFLPQEWLIDGSGVSLGALLAAAPELERLELQLAPLDGYRPAEVRGQELALAAWLDQQGLIEARLNGRDWLGIALDPSVLPDVAQTELQDALNRWAALLGDGQRARGESVLTRIALLMEALGENARLGLVYETLADVRGALGRWRDAASAQQRAVATHERLAADPPVMLTALRRLGDMAARIRDWQTAFNAYDRALALATTAGDTSEQLRLRARIAEAREVAGQYQQALDLSTALLADLPDAAVEPRLVELLRQARLLRVYFNRYADAGRVLDQAAALAEAAGNIDVYLDIRLDSVRVLAATADFDAGLAVLEELRPLAAARPAAMAQLHLETANIQWLRSQYFESLGSQARALEELDKVDRPDIRIAVHNASGLTSWAVNDLERAHRELDRALELATANGLDAEVASTSNNKGLVLRSQARYDEALEWFGRSLAIDVEQGNRWGEAYSLRNIGITHTQAGRPAEAIKPLRRAVELATAIGDLVNQTKALVALADALLDLGLEVEARACYTDALALADRIPLPEMRWRCHHGLGRIALARGDQQQALASFSTAVDIIDGLRASIRIEEFQDGFLADKQSVYTSTIRLLLDMGREAEALEASEKSRGRNFIDMLGNRTLALGNEQDQAAVAAERRLRSSIERLERERLNATPTRQAAITAELDQLIQSYTDQMLLLRAQQPAAADFVRVQPVTLAEIQSLIDPGTALLVYHQLDDEVVIWFVTPTELRTVRQRVDIGELSRQIGRLRQRMQGMEPIQAELAFVGNALVAPIAPLLAGISHVGVVPHRELHLLPFAALPTGLGDALIDRVAIYYTPSASVLRYTRARRPDRGAADRVLGIGNPDLGTRQFDLPFAEREARRLRFDYPDARIVTGAEATETWLVENAADFSIIHIASHGQFDPDSPLSSRILLAADDRNSGDLSAEEVFALRMRADLIALSACQSGLGRLSAGDEIIGLNRAFVYAGSRQILTTLWRVDDVATALLFKHFYRNARTMDRAEAMRRSQLLLRSRPEYAHPVYWAPLVLSGDWY